MTPKEAVKILQDHIGESDDSSVRAALMVLERLAKAINP